MTDDDARALLTQIRDLAMSPYPFAEESDIHPIRIFTLGEIAGLAIKANQVPALAPEAAADQ